MSRQPLLTEVLGEEIARRLSCDVCVISASSPSAVADCWRAAPSIILLDLGDRAGGDVTFVGTLLAEFPGVGIVVLGDLEIEDVVELVGRGVRACLPYSASVADVAAAVDSAFAGHAVVPIAAVAELLSGSAHRCPPPSRTPALSGREVDVLCRLCAGHATRAIARELGISVATVRKHVQNILSKLGVHSKLEAAAYATRHGIALGEVNNSA